MSLVIENIGLLVTNDPEHGERRDVSLVIADGAVAEIAESSVAADERIDAAGRCVIPGFVDSHTHLVFAGDRSDEFAARMAGAPYAAGGINVTTEATRATPTEALIELARGAAGRGAAVRHHPHRDQVRLRPGRRARAAHLRGRRRADR